jgi:polyhydroxybutyrate depolymerase
MAAKEKIFFGKHSCRINIPKQNGDREIKSQGIEFIHRMKKVFLLFLLMLSFFSCKKDDDNSSDQKTIYLTIDGTARNFVIYLPEGHDDAGLMPMIFALHGTGGTPDDMIKVADFRTIADRDKIVLVYPAGIQKDWNDGRTTVPHQLGINDVSFFSQVIDYMITNYSVDATKIYATGLSSGGFMVSRLGSELSNKIAAIAPVAATIEQNTIYPNCNPGRPVPAIYIHGTDDPLVPFNGGAISEGNCVSHLQAIDKWVSINNCDTTPAITNLPDIADDGTSILETKYTGGTNGSEVVSYIITNGGHTWPQGYQYLPVASIGITSQDMNACEVIWQFFKRFSR